MSTVTVLPTLRLSLIDLRDQGSLAIVDLSSYSTIPITANVSMQITPPGWPTLNVPFNPGTVNVYKCADLGIICAVTECCPLPDGIYAVTYTVGPAVGVPLPSITKTFIKTDQIECRFMNAFLKVDLECDCSSEDQKKYKQELKEIDLLINGAKAAANSCDDTLAYRLYAQADKCIDRIYSRFCLYCGAAPSCEQCS